MVMGPVMGDGLLGMALVLTKPVVTKVGFGLGRCDDMGPRQELVSFLGKIKGASSIEVSGVPAGPMHEVFSLTHN